MLKIDCETRKLLLQAMYRLDGSLYSEAQGSELLRRYGFRSEFAPGLEGFLDLNEPFRYSRVADA